MGVQSPRQAPRQARDALPSLSEHIAGHVYVQTAHQAVAWDAVARLSGPNAGCWRRLFHGQAQLLTLGARAPDTEFRDFKNHMVLPREGYWGGAIGRAQSWYQNLVVALSRSEWSNAAYCAGVLAHYVTDALHPLHTAQSAAENDIHFACDLTTEMTLTPLRRMAAAVQPREPITLAAGPGFLAPAIAASADMANTCYESLLAHFDLQRALADPTAGLDVMGQRLMAGVLDDQIRLLAAILDRAIADAGVAAPATTSRGARLRNDCRAALAWPVTRVRWLRRISAARKHVAAMFDEISAAGRATTTLPDEERTKRDLYANEIVARRTKVAVDNVFPFDPRRQIARPPDKARSAVIEDDDGGEVVVLDRRRAVIDPPRPAPRWVQQDPVRKRSDVVRIVAQTTAEQPQPARLAARLAAVSERASPPPAPVGVGHAAAALLLPTSAEGLSNFRDRRRATLESVTHESAAPEISAPALLLPGIGAVEAQMIQVAGITTLDEFIAADPDALGARILPQPISAAILGAWQARVRLLATVPELTGTEADLLSGSGYNSAAAIADGDAEKVCADILAYVATPAGKAALVAGAPPDIAKVRAVIAAARAARAA